MKAFGAGACLNIFILILSLVVYYCSRKLMHWFREAEFQLLLSQSCMAVILVDYQIVDHNATTGRQ